MDVNKTLISTAMLTAIFEKTNKSNIDLIAPFVLYIISEYDTGIDEDTIIKKMETEFSFLEFPHAVLKIIINKLKKDNKIKQEDKKYFILDSAKKEIEVFNERHQVATNDTKEILDDIWKYISNKTTIKTSYANIRSSFGSFLDRNGYIIYNNFNPQNFNIKNNDKIQFFIAKYIEEQYNNDTKLFKKLIYIIEGLLLANVIYLQITPDNSMNLNKLSCYFDTPFLLRIIEFKEREDNVSANELVELLKNQGAKIKCFRHSFNEVQSILRNYIDKKDMSYETKTLEGLDIEDYNDTELNEIYMNLEDIFKSKGIIIEDKPPYEKLKYIDNKYEDQIGEAQLKECIINRYKNKDIKDITIENDVDSISAIVRLREGKKIQKFEDCNAIFVTSNHDIRTATNQLLKINETLEISPVISDTDLTAIIWLRSLKDHSDIPKDKLIENARALLKPSASIIEEFNNCLDKIKKTKYVKDGKALQALIYTTHFSAKFMDEIQGDANKVNPRAIIKVYEDSLIEAELISKENENEKRKNNKLLVENENLSQKLIEKEKEYDKIIKKLQVKYDNKIDRVINCICNFSKIFINILILVVFIVGILDIIHLIDFSTNLFLSWILIILAIYSFLSQFINVPFLFNITDLISKSLYTNLSPVVTKHYRKQQREESDYLFSDK